MKIISRVLIFSLLISSARFAFVCPRCLAYECRSKLNYTSTFDSLVAVFGSVGLHENLFIMWCKGFFSYRLLIIFLVWRKEILLELSAINFDLFDILAVVLNAFVNNRYLIKKIMNKNIDFSFCLLHPYGVVSRVSPRNKIYLKPILCSFISFSYTQLSTSISCNEFYPTCSFLLGLHDLPWWSLPLSNDLILLQGTQTRFLRGVRNFCNGLPLQSMFSWTSSYCPASCLVKNDAFSFYFWNCFSWELESGLARILAWVYS